MNRLLVVVMLVACQPPRAAPAPAASTDRSFETATDAYLAPLIALEVFQGAVLVARGDRILLDKGYGFANVELGVPNTPARVFRIASLSKPFTEVALGKLVEENRLELAAPLARYLAEFPNAERITIEMLRTHRAGIPNVNSLPYDEEATAPNTLEALVAALAKHPLDFPPGSKERYSNGGYALLARVIEKVTGASYDDYLKQAVLEPLGLTETRHERDQMLIPGRSFGYMPSPERRPGLIVAPFQEMATKTGGGSLVSTTADLRRFLRAAYRDNVIRAATWTTLFPPADGFAFQGRCPGYNVYMLRDVEHDIAVVVLANNYAAGMVATIGRDLAAMAAGKSVSPPHWRADLHTDPASASSYVGTLRAPKGALVYGDEFQIAWRAPDLVAVRAGRVIDVLVPQGGGAFLLRTMWSELKFGGAGVTIRPLWLDNAPVKLERVAR